MTTSVERAPFPRLRAAGAALQRLRRRAQQLMNDIDAVAEEAPRLVAMERRRDFCLMAVEGKAAIIAGIPGQSLADLLVKVEALAASNDGALREDGDPLQTAPEALCWSLVRDIRAMAGAPSMVDKTHVSGLLAKLSPSDLEKEIARLENAVAAQRAGQLLGVLSPEQRAHALADLVSLISE